MKEIANGTFTVELQPVPFEGVSPASKLGRLTISKQYHGDLQATAMGQMLSGMTETKGSAGYVALEYVEGTLHGRAGSFLLQHNGMMNRGAASLIVTVVPDSGTGELQGLDGTLEILVENGNHSYEFRYTLPDRDGQNS